jgi:predicted acylesterase/phospholipase RssA
MINKSEPVMLLRKIVAFLVRAGKPALVPARLTLLAPVAVLILAGCATGEVLRLPQPQADMIAGRRTVEERMEADRRSLITRNVARVKAEYDVYVSGGAAAPPVFDFLVISGGGDWGAFGAGVLKGWGRIPPGPMSRPVFDAVTGVSTGALIAPFAFLNDDASIDRIVELYRNPKSDWIKPRGLLTFLTGGASYADTPGLERDIRETLDVAMMRRLVEDGKDGRILAVNTSNLDFGEMRAWDLIAETRRALETGERDRVYSVLLASAGIPGAFPPRMIDGNLYVDGAITGNILYGARIPEEDGFVTVWKRNYPQTPVPKIRYWLIFNNQRLPPPEVVQPKWTSVLPRSTTTATRTATINSIRHLFALAEVSRLKQDADIEVRFMAVPDDWTPRKPGIFIKEVMNDLADMGESMGADPSNWQTVTP